MKESDKQMLADHYLDLYRMAFVLLQNEADVEDVVQEALAVTMSKTWVKDPYKYCLQVLYNQCYKMVKGKEDVLVENMPETVEQDDDVDERRLKMLWEMKNELPKSEREVLDLYYVRGLTKGEIAKKKGLTIAIVKRLFNRGHNLLRTRMLEIEKGENR